MDINKKSSKPLYKQIVEIIIHDISSNNYDSGYKLPTEIELTNKYEVSRTTVRKAINELISKDIVEVHQGKGTYIKKALIQMDMSNLDGFYEIFTKQKVGINTKTIKYEKVYPSKYIARFFGILKKNEEKVPFFQRLYNENDNILGIVTTYLSPKTNFSWSQIKSQKVYPLLRKEQKVTLKEASYIVSSVSATKEKADVLEVPENYPLLRLQRNTYCTKGELWEVSFLELKSELYEFKFNIDKGENKLKEYFGLEEKILIDSLY